MRTRYIVDPGGDSWQHFALSEWELEAAGWTDAHPHDEINIVVEGELHVETEGNTVILHSGDAVTVTAGSTGSYWAPRYARMIGVYGPNPDGAESDYIRYWDIDSTAAESTGETSE
ncbi:MAG: cupin domain-containing protein [Microbacteriaceae bacterium]|nr:MAG: cupin domain-containing protein [Microbacteriaceae bacterium]